MLSSRCNDVLEDPITGRDLNGLAVNASLQELLSYVGSKAPLPENDTCMTSVTTISHQKLYKAKQLGNAGEQTAAECV